MNYLKKFINELNANLFKWYIILISFSVLFLSSVIYFALITYNINFKPSKFLYIFAILFFILPHTVYFVIIAFFIYFLKKTNKKVYRKVILFFIFLILLGLSIYLFIQPGILTDSSLVALSRSLAENFFKFIFLIAILTWSAFAIGIAGFILAYKKISYCFEIFLFLFMLIIFVGFIIGLFSGGSLLETYQGTLIMLLVPLIYFVGLNLDIKNIELNNIFRLLFNLFIIAVALLGVFKLVFILFFGGFNMLIPYELYIFPFAYLVVVTNSNINKKNILFIILISLVALLSLQKTIYISILVVIFLNFILNFKEKINLKFIWFLGIIFFVFLFALYSNLYINMYNRTPWGGIDTYSPLSSTEHINKLPEVFVTAHLKKSSEISVDWRIAEAMSIKNEFGHYNSLLKYIFGFGNGASWESKFFPQYKTSLFPFMKKTGESGIDPHNVFLAILFKNGLLGLSVYLIFYFLLFIQLIKLLKRINKQEKQLAGVYVKVLFIYFTAFFIRGFSTGPEINFNSIFAIMLLLFSVSSKSLTYENFKISAMAKISPSNKYAN